MVQWINFHNGDTGLLIRERLNDYNSSTMVAINNGEALIEDLYLRYDDIAADLTHHVNDLVNPHQVTKEQVGLGFITDVGSGVHYLNDSGTYTDPVVNIDFIDLEDTPDNYVGQQGMMLKVNATEDGLTYGSPSGVSVAWGDILGTLSNQIDLQDELDAKENLLGLGNAGQILATNQAVDGKEWIDIPDNGIPEAPSDGTPYGRQDTTWVNVEVAGSADTVQGNLDSHTGNISNPHSVTQAQVGLGNVDNIADLDKPISTDTQTALDTKVMTAQENGVGILLGNTLIVTQAEYDALTPIDDTMYVIVE